MITSQKKWREKQTQKNENNLDLIEAFNQIKNANKNNSKAFLFQKDNDSIITDEYINEDKARQTVKAFNAIDNEAKTIEGIESITLQCKNGKLNITHVDDHYLTTLDSEESDEISIDNFNALPPAALEEEQEIAPLTQIPQEAIPEYKLEEEPYQKVKNIQPLENQESFEPNPEQTEWSEFTVDNMGRLGMITSAPDTVRLDIVTLGRWTDLYGENKIKEIMITNSDNQKTIKCKFEQIKDSKFEQTGSVLVPEKIQHSLQVKKGGKVLIKPLIVTEIPEEPIENTANEEPEKKDKQKPFLPGSPKCQLVVEDISGFSGLIGGSETVRFDGAMLERWKEFYGEQEINEVVIEDTMLSKTVRCKFKIVKDSKFEGKGIIQMPKSIQQELGIQEGSLVTIKPVVE